MEISSVSNLCLQLISSAFQRCRVSDDLCNLSVRLKSFTTSDRPVVQVSISDTGVGSCLQEFRYLKLTGDGIGIDKWDGLLSVKTTSISDDEIFNYQLDLRESRPRKRFTQLASSPKNGAKFSGSEVCLSASESINLIQAEIDCFLQKISVLKILNVVIEVVVEGDKYPGSQYENVYLMDKNNTIPFSTLHFERLKSGLEDYIRKHGNRLKHKCTACYQTGEHYQVGSGTACSSERRRISRQIMEVVIVISELESSCPCFATCSSRTEVLYFRDFAPCSISKSSLDALTSVDWESYGLTLGDISRQGGYFVEWENLPPSTHIAMALHCYNEQALMPSARKKIQPDGRLLKKAIVAALNNLKEKYPGILLSSLAVKVRNYAPDLAKSISGLILSSSDPDFQEECLSLLGLQSGESSAETVEDHIKEKINLVIGLKDRKSQRSMEVAPFLFENDSCRDNSYFLEDVEEVDMEDEYEFSYQNL